MDKPREGNGPIAPFLANKPANLNVSRSPIQERWFNVPDDYKWRCRKNAPSQ